MRGSLPREPCGTEAAYKRHRHNGEKPCADCRAAEARRSAQRRRNVLPVGTRPKESEIRDPVVPYRYRARRYPWAVRVLARAEATWGRPEDEEAA